MPGYRTAYPPEFRSQMVDLVQSGRTPEELAREFKPPAQWISTSVKQAERDAACALTGRQALSRMNRGASDVRTIACVRSETSWQRQQPGSRGREGEPERVHERAPGRLFHSYKGPRLEGVGLGLLGLAEPAGFGLGDRRRRSDASHPHDPRWITWTLWRVACSCRAEG
jgi:hypothetical protein